MKLPAQKTKIVCTIGPASRSEEILTGLIRAGMTVARLNFSHGAIEDHERDIRMIRAVAAREKRIIPIMIDLPGPKIRVGKLPSEPIQLKKGEILTLFAGEASDDETRIPVEYERLSESVSVGNTIFLNDGFIQLKIQSIQENAVRCSVLMGGPLFSKKGLNFPKAKLSLDAITDRDLELIDYGLNVGVDIFCISFVNRSDDIVKVREYVRKKGKAASLIAKIERAEAVRNIEEILEVSDGIMVARGDLGVEIPIEEVPVVQKRLIHEANLRGLPVITATQMLESMTDNVRPTRAEVTDVANAILDGTDAIMLSEETAIGHYPVESVGMMVRIAATIENRKVGMPFFSDRSYLQKHMDLRKITVEDTISINVIEASRFLKIRYILTPTHTGSTPRRISRFKPECWILGFCRDERIQNFLFLSYGVFPFLHPEPQGGHEALSRFLKQSGLAKRGDRVILTEMIMPGQVGGIDSMGIFTLA